MPTWFVIRNPVSGNGKGSRDWPRIESALAQYFEIESHPTESRGHASKLAYQAFSQGFRHFILCGGDGTLHEAVNGIGQHGLEALKECTIGAIPIGTGNDWTRTMGLRGDYETVAQALSPQRVILQDLMEVTFSDLDGNTQKRLAMNMAGAGFDSFVANRVNQIFRKKRGISKWSYLLQLARCLFQYRPSEIQLTADDLEIHDKLYTVAIGVGQYNGGGMRQCPDAHPGDGELDLTVIRSISKFTVIRKLPGLFSGNFVKHPKVSTHRTKQAELRGPWQIEADGESLGNLPAKIRILPKALPVLVHPKKADQWSNS